MKNKYSLIQKNRLVEKDFLQKIFNIYITFINRSVLINYEVYASLLKKEIVFDILSLAAISPHDVKKIVFSKNLDLIFYLKDTLHCLLYDFLNALKLLFASFFFKTIIVSSKRWVKDKNEYEVKFKKILNFKSNRSYKFIYFKTRKHKPENKITLALREKIYTVLIDKFEELSENYKKAIKTKLHNNSDHFLSVYNSQDIKLFFQKSKNICSQDNIFSFFISMLIGFIYNILNKITLRFIRTKTIYLVNTNMWSVGNIFIENILLRKDINFIGCQHGAGYKERKFLSLDYEIYCPAFNKFVGFKLFKDKICASQILNLNSINRGEMITYINGSGKNRANVIFYQKDCLEIISKLSFFYKCSIRVHPRQSLNLIKDNFLKNQNNKTNIDNVNVFKSTNKFESISNSVKICLFDNPHNTLFWEAHSKGIKNILIYDVNLDQDLSAEFLKIFDLIINPSIKGWQNEIIKEIKNFLS